MACPTCGNSLRDLGGGKAAARLELRQPDGVLSEFALGAAKTTLGRHPANLVRLSDREVSKEHATIERLGGSFVLRDLGSSNGTFVNGRRVREFRLKDGDEIALGNNCKLVFRDGKPESTGFRSGVTVVTSAQSIPAFVAELDQRQENEFLPADERTNLEALKQDYEKLRIAHKFHQQIGLERDAKSLAEKILKVAFELLAAERGVLFLVDPKTGELRDVADKARTDASKPVEVSETVLQRVKKQRQAVLTKDAIVDARFSTSQSIVAQGIRSAMAVPLLSGDVLKGVLFLDSREKSNAFSEKDLKILSGIAAQAAIALENAELAGKIEAEAITRAELARFLSKAVADAVIRGEVELLRESRVADISVVFADIRSFTTMAESDDPKDTVDMLNEFFSAMAEVIFRFGGNLDKFIGDCVMAVWGPPQETSDGPLRALRAAMDMQTEVAALNQRRLSEGKRPIEVGIGVSTGPAVVGYMGTPERHEFTAIGDTVNVAARLCSMAKGTEVLATETTVQRAGNNFDAVPLPTSHVKGKERGVATYRVLGFEDTSSGRRR